LCGVRGRRRAFVRLLPVNVTIEEVTLDPEGILHRVLDGETVVVTADDRPVAEIRPVEHVRRPRPFGLAAGAFVVPDDFDAPLPEDVLRDFE
jgi:antitoxin (DNA-binding transcriptional repressor) of toxin-antitoxin stability system